MQFPDIDARESAIGGGARGGGRLLRGVGAEAVEDLLVLVFCGGVEARYGALYFLGCFSAGVRLDWMWLNIAVVEKDEEDADAEGGT